MDFTREESAVLMQRILSKGNMISKIDTEYQRIVTFEGNKCPAKANILQRKEEAVVFTQFAIDYFRHQYPEQIRFMEIGTNRGGNFVLIGNMLQEVFNNVYGVGINLTVVPCPEHPKHGWEYQKNLSGGECIKNLKPKFKWRFIDGDSTKEKTIKAAQEAALIEGRRLDLLYIDGAHDCPTCIHDWDYYVGMVKSSGLIAIHDVAGCYQNKGVMVWNRFAPYYKHWVFGKGHNRGVGVIRLDRIMVR
jgi:hypothetical protein